MSDLHKYPFPVISSAKHGRCTCQEKRVGIVSEEMDKDIGKMVLKMKGSVSANNYVEFDGLNLHGQHVYIQYKLMKSMIATFHIELITSSKTSMRISMSTLYPAPKCIGTILRLPLPVNKGWVCVGLNLDALLEKYAGQSLGEHTVSQRIIKKIQLCSSMEVREVVTSDKPLVGAKDLAMKPGVACEWIDMSHFLEGVPAAIDSPESVAVMAASGKGLQTPSAAVLRSYTPSPSSASASAPTSIYNDVEIINYPLLPSPEVKNEETTASFTSPGSLFPISPIRSPAPKMEARPRSLSPAKPTAPAPPRRGTSTKPVLVETPKPKLMKIQQADIADLYSRLCKPSSRSTTRNNLKSEHYTNSSQHETTAPVEVSTVSVPKPPTPVTNAERILHLGRVMGYQGGPTLLIQEGKLVVFASGPLIVLLDVESCSEEMLCSASPGIWRNFAPTSAARVAPLGQRPCGEDGFRQAFLRGHSRRISLLEISSSGRLMASCEAGPEAALIVWDMKQGKRLATIYPHSESISSIAFSPDGSILATCGIDAQHRTQIIVWDVQMLLMDRGSALNTTRGLNPTAAIVAKQISDFHIVKLKFLPFDETLLQNNAPIIPATTAPTIPSAASASEPGLVSCGRENIRFWRIRKGHLPGRPVMLNEFSRGYSFTDIAFHAEPSENLHVPMSPFVFVSSSRGVLFKVDPITEKIVCSFQLHNSSILTLFIQGGYAVTGSQDAMLRVWPMNFSDFLLEAHHEGPVSSVHVTGGGKKLVVGTTAGTLGVLNVVEHAYITVLRSHIGVVNCVVPRLTTLDEFITLGKDGTVRIWDTLTLLQKYEFSSPEDEPKSVAYCTTTGVHQIAVGFVSGYVRVFDVPSTTTLYERRQHTAPVMKLVYSPCGERLYSAALDGCVCVYDALNHFFPIKTMIIASAQNMRPTQEFSPLAARRVDERLEVNTIHLALNDAGTLLVSSGPTISSLVVFSTEDLVAVMRCGGHAALQLNSHPALTSGSLRSRKSGSSRQRRRASSVSSRSDRSESGSVSSRGSYSSRSSTASKLRSRSAGKNRKKSNVATAAVAISTTPQAEGAVVTGLSFCEDRPGGAILVITDKIAISLPLDIENLVRTNPTAPKKKQVSSGGGWSVKKFDFGVAKFSVRDPLSGLLFVPFTFPSQVSPVKIGKGPVLKDSNTINDGLAMVHAAHKLVRIGESKDPRSGEMKSISMQVSLQLSNAQVYQDSNLTIQGNNITDVCACIPYGRVISVDNCGNIAVWFVDEKKLDDWKTPDAIPEGQKAPSRVESMAGGKVDSRMVTTLNEPKQSIIRSPDRSSVNHQPVSVHEISEAGQDHLSDTSDLSVEGIEIAVSDGELYSKGLGYSATPILLETLNTERVIKMDSQRVAILDIIEHNAEIEASNLKALQENIRPYPYQYPYSYDDVVQSTRVIDVGEVERERRRVMKEALKAEGIAYEHLNLEKKKTELEEFEEAEEILIVGDDNFDTESMKDYSSALGDAQVDSEGNLDDCDTDAVLRRNTDSNKEGKTKKSSIPIPGLESWVNVFKEAAAEAQAEQMTRLKAMLDDQPEESDSKESFLVTVNTVTRQLPVCPNITKGNLLTSDGSAVYLNGNSTGSKEEVHLKRPVSPDETSVSPSALASVLLTSISPCGQFIAVVTWTLDDEVYGVTRAPYSELIIWKYYQAPTPERTARQIVRNITIKTPEPEWVCISVARLYEIALSPTGPIPKSVLMNPPISSNHSYISWSTDSKLILLTPIIVTHPDEINAKVSTGKDDSESSLSLVSDASAALDEYFLTFIPSDFLASLNIDVPNDLTETLRHQGKLISLDFDSCDLLGMKVMCPPDITSSSLPRIILWSESQLIILAADESKRCGWKECWIEDIGAHGPYISVDAVLCHSAVDVKRRYLISSLDSNGALRYATFPLEDRELNKALRKSYIAKMPGVSAAGTLRSMVLTVSSDITHPYNPCHAFPYTILGSSSSVRLYFLIVNDEYSRNLRNPENQTIHVTLNPVAKVVLGFLPEYIVPFKLSDSGKVGINRNAISFLAADKLGNVSIAAVHCEKEVTEDIARTGVVAKTSVRRISTEPKFLSNDKNGSLAVSVPHRFLHDGVDEMMQDTESSSSAVVVTQDNGKVIFTHSPSGIQLTPPGTVGFNNCSCLSTTSDSIAIGLKSGRIAIHNSVSLELSKLVDPLFLYEKIMKSNKKVVDKQKKSSNLKKLESLVARRQYKKSSDPSGPIFKAGSVLTLSESQAEDDLHMNNSPIESMMFLYNGAFLVAARENKSVTLYDLRGDGVSVKDYIQMPRPSSRKSAVAKAEDGDEDEDDYKVFLVGSFSAGKIKPELTYAHPGGIWGILRVFSPYRVEMDVFYTQLGEMRARNGPEDVPSQMYTEKLAVLTLQDEKLAQEIENFEREGGLGRRSRLSTQAASDTNDNIPMTDSIRALPIVSFLGAHLSVDMVDDEDELPPDEEFAGKSSLLFKTAIKQKKKFPLNITVVAVLTVDGQSTSWASVGSVILDAKKKVPRINDNKKDTISVGKQAHRSIEPSLVFTKKTIPLIKALRIGLLSSFVYHENLLVVASHGGVRVYDIHALLYNREVAMHNMIVEQQRMRFAALTLSAAEIADHKADGDEKLDSEIKAPDAAVQAVKEETKKDHRLKERMRVCIGALGGMDTDKKSSTTFGQVNWAGSSIAIAKKHRKDIGTLDSTLPDVYIARAFPPCLIRMVLPDDNAAIGGKLLGAGIVDDDSNDDA